VYEGNFNKKLKLKSQTTKVLHQKILEKNPTNPIAKRGEIMVKGAMGAKIKVFFQRLHMPCVIYVLLHNLFFCILDTLFNTTF
jgi:hypothetical protein